MLAPNWIPFVITGYTVLPDGRPVVLKASSRSDDVIAKTPRKSGEVLSSEILSPRIRAQTSCGEGLAYLLRCLVDLQRVAQHLAAGQERLPHLHSMSFKSAHKSWLLNTLGTILQLTAAVAGPFRAVDTTPPGSKQ